MKQRIRTFVAIEVSSGVRDCAADLIGELHRAQVDVKWVDPANMHLTLKFLGDVDARGVYEVCRAVQNAAAPLAPFDLQISGAGAFPNVRRPRTLWVGASEGEPALAALAEGVESELHKLGFRRESRRFHAHLTVGRVRHAGPAMDDLSQLLTDYADFDLGRTHVGEVVVFSSTLDRSGPIYERLGRASLGSA